MARTFVHLRMGGLGLALLAGALYAALRQVNSVGCEDLVRASCSVNSSCLAVSSPCAILLIVEAWQVAAFCPKPLSGVKDHVYLQVDSCLLAGLSEYSTLCEELSCSPKDLAQIMYVPQLLWKTRLQQEGTLNLSRGYKVFEGFSTFASARRLELGKLPVQISASPMCCWTCFIPSCAFHPQQTQLAMQVRKHFWRRVPLHAKDLSQTE